MLLKSYMAIDEKRIKMAIIAGASHAVAYMRKHRMADEDEVIRHVSQSAHEILERIDDPL